MGEQQLNKSVSSAGAQANNSQPESPILLPIWQDQLARFVALVSGAVVFLMIINVGMGRNDGSGGCAAIAVGTVLALVVAIIFGLAVASRGE